MRWVAGMAIAAIAVLLFFAVRERVTTRATNATAREESTPAEANPEEPANEAMVFSKALGGTGEPEPQEEEEAPEPGSRPERRPDPPWPEERSEEAPEAVVVPIQLTGTLSVDGNLAPDGTFQLGWVAGWRWDRDLVEVHAGAWSAEVPAGSELTFEDVCLGGRRALAVDPVSVAPESGKVALTCCWFVPTVLRVVDAEAGNDLDAVEIVLFDVMAWRHDRSIHPGPPSAKRASTVVSGATSPVTLPEEEGHQIYWVRAPEHAWTRLEVVHGFGGERVVCLPKAGTLDVRLLNFDPASEAELRLYELGGGHRLSWPAAERVRIDSLAPGKYDVRVEIGEWFHKPLRLGGAIVAVEAGAVREVALTLDSVPGPEGLVPFAGTLQIDPGWGKDLGGIEIDVQGVDVPPGTEDPRVHLATDGHWSAGRVPPGRYSVSVGPWSQLVDVGPSGSPDVRIVVPAPCDVEVRVLLADRDEVAPVETLNWGLVEGSDEHDAACEAPGRFRFRAPPAVIAFVGYDEQFKIQDHVVRLRPGLNRITLRAERKYGFKIEVKDALTGTTLRADDDFWPRITVAGVGPECRAADTPSSSTIRVTKPGRYRVMFLAEIDGFRSIDDQEVDVPAEGLGLLVVRLERK